MRFLIVDYLKKKKKKKMANREEVSLAKFARGYVYVAEEKIVERSIVLAHRKPSSFVADV